MKRTEQLNKIHEELSQILKNTSTLEPAYDKIRTARNEIGTAIFLIRYDL